MQSMANRDNTTATPVNFGKVRECRRPVQRSLPAGWPHVSECSLRGQELGETVKATYLNPARQHGNLARDTLIAYTGQ